ncbi:hypothetical protein GCK72_019740 [Caenorhabditis remanei]|uniref:F-box domain-containing protein n=1 Tax=Caenorhabditis remanei TaxID=31234 RepID=A0A6A5GEL9_CAERE|nr:hypothetical protein GCK72_019740 [Caenorhabditis remanei]KAF1753184.1 hypothetical protein GCK72_019740 [Caenorhabditis remanei]
MPNHRKRRPRVGLTDMPEVVMKNILEKSNFQSILKLRKVSRDFRNFIDDEKPEFHLEIIGIHMTSEQIKIFLKGLSENEAPHIEYQKHEKGCQIVCSRRTKSKTYLLENEDFVEVFCREFEQIMSHQKNSVLLSFSLTAPNIPDEFKRILKAKPIPIKTQIFAMTTKTHSQVMDVLPHMNPKYLKELCFYSSANSPHKKWIFDGIVESDQWKTAKTLEAVQFFVDVPLKNFHHFSAGNYFVNAVTAEELFELKENYLNSNKLKRVFIGYLDEEPLKEQELHALFGKPYFPNPRRKVDRGRWYFRVADTDTVIHLVLYFAKTLQFSLVKLNTPPIQY